MSTITKAYRSNSKARKWLEANGYKDVHLFPHTRYVKDVHFSDQDFDGIAAKDCHIVLFQIKTNARCTKKTLANYSRIGKKYNCVCLWINNATKKKIFEVNNVSV